MTSDVLTRDDPRYQDMFDVEKETVDAGHVLIDDLYGNFARLRTDGAVFDGSIVRELTGHDDAMFSRPRPHVAALSFEACRKALLNNKIYSSLLYHEQPGVMQNIGHTILTMVGNEHARHRTAVQPMMTREYAMNWWRSKWIEPFVAVLVDDIEREGSVDLSLQLCARLPMHTVTAAYGLTSEQALEFRESMLNSLSPKLSEAMRETANIKVRDILLRGIAERREKPADDLISRLISAPFIDASGNSGHLDDQAILSFSRLLLLAGGGTTFRQLGITLFALLSNPDQMEALRADRSLMPAAIAESLRWNCTDPLFYRLVTQDSVLEGFAIPEGTIIDICLGAANHDPARWDRPDVYDLHRPEQVNIGFAAGAHSCLGRFVAEAEMTAAINALLDRLPRMRLDDRGEPARMIGGLHARGVNHLRVRCD